MGEKQVACEICGAVYLVDEGHKDGCPNGRASVTLRRPRTEAFADDLFASGRASPDTVAEEFDAEWTVQTLAAPSAERTRWGRVGRLAQAILVAQGGVDVATALTLAKSRVYAEIDKTETADAADAALWKVAP